MNTSLHAVLPGRPAEERRAALRALLASGRAFVAPGVTDAAGIRLVEEAGFGCAYLTGAGLANAQYGLPDIGLLSQREVVDHVRRLADATDLPLIVDADTGYGGSLSVMRTVRQLIDAGAAAVQLEDQVLNKRCGHFDEHQLVSAEEMAGKIEAAVAARGDSRLVLIARTDARGVLGLDEAIARARAYAAAGADVIFVEAPRTVEEMRVIATELAGVPLLANIVEGGKTPELSLAELEELGFTVALFANYLMRSMLHAGRAALAHLARAGETRSRADALLPWADRQRLFSLAGYTELEQRFTAGREGA
ncbi:Phosphoenolpyruvate phosphomutase [Thermomonospora echinospora]|uniref:Phosphoenolpyruvate phosphomutase n=1 Tax=Thermomonospora echinospora TaxID=1992 RepID=A0A1H6C049_9ACTN|nr:oxaloacetate decarboxylase [Thermomonospora echinospora]SEG66117.1 Phosphoenolpyruvate phosphomutase [Thermomonospora echinospora]